MINYVYILREEEQLDLQNNNYWVFRVEAVPVLEK